MNCFDSYLSKLVNITIFDHCIMRYLSHLFAMLSPYRLDKYRSNLLRIS